ncbi:MAG TPA: TonB-dependent receptor [Rhodanobacteraceae bacterium]|nr:TonB-dependent receptor [Rhodanobacteraceae bacterium]
MNRKLLATAICAGLFVTGSAFAQDNPAPTQQQQDQSTTNQSTTDQSTTNNNPSSDNSDNVTNLQGVTVTGSLLKRPEYETTVPVQVVPIKADEAAGMFNVTNFVQSTAAAAGSTQINGQFGGFIIEGGTGVQPVDLRGLGAQRTLVLLDGQRPGPAGTRGQVNNFDLNVIPRAIIGRIEIVKDGSSSIYGSDAIAGVVNLITKKRLDKTTMDFFVSAPEHDGGEQYQASIATGWNFNNGNVTLAAEVDRQQELKTGQRDFFNCTRDIVYGPDGQRVDRPAQWGVFQDLAPCNNLLVATVIDPFSGARYVPSGNGTTGPNSPVPGYHLTQTSTYATTPTPFGDQPTNFPQYGDTYAIDRNQSSTAYLASSFSFGSVNWDTQLILNRRTTNDNEWRQFFPVVFNDNGWSTADSSFYGGAGTSHSGFEPVMLFPFNSKITVDYGYLRTGFSGGFGDSSWSWAINGSYSRSSGDYDTLAINAANSGDWNNPLNQITGRSLVNYFDPGFLDGSKVNELVGALGQFIHGNTVYKQQDVNAVANGNLFDLPAGPVSAAFGAEYRHYSIDDKPPPATWGLTTAGETQGADHVSEVFGEIGVPIVKGVPGIESLALDLSGREFKYGSVGSSAHVWKYGLNWEPFPTFRVRGTIGTSYRAPGLFELYLANQTGFLSQLSVDPCINWGESSNTFIQTNCAAAGIPSNYAGNGGSALISQGGGAGFLKPETSRAKTLGFVWSPTFANLQVAVDYFDYNIRGEIATLGAGDIVTGCYNKPVYPNEFCTHFHRNPATGNDPFSITDIHATYININQQRDRGYDLQLNYANDFPFGRLTVDGEWTYTLEHIQQEFSSAAASGFGSTNFTGSIGNPYWVGIMDAALKRGNWTYSWQGFYTSATSDYRFAPTIITYRGMPDVTQNLRMGAQLRHSVSVGYDQGKVGITFGIRNLFDATPPQISSGAPENLVGNTAIGATQYDWFGRTYFARLNITL